MYGFLRIEEEERQADQKKKTGETNIHLDETRVVGRCSAAGDDCLIFPVRYNSFKRHFLSWLCSVFRVPLFI
jgi:hypothetical protein